MFKRKRKVENKPSGMSDKAAGKLAKLLMNIQQAFVFIMNKLVSNMAPKHLKLLLIAFCLSGGGFSIYLVVHAVEGKDKHQAAFEVKPVSVPRYIDKSGSEVNEGHAGVSEELYQDIQAYKRHMDSLGQAIRPGLLDSIRLLEQIYQTQK